jgi:type II secretory pathway pseudopilin PulG
MPANKPALRQRGAVLLILLAVLALAGASLLISAFGGSAVDKLRIQRTQMLLAEATDALTGFAAANGRLPRPAASATDGRERPQPCASDEQCTGFLPWVALGVAGEDAWGKRLRYSVTPAFTSYDYQPATAAATRTVQQRGADGELHYLAGGPACTAQLRCAALVVLSHGKHNHGTSVLGVEQANAGPEADKGEESDEAVNATASTHFITRAASSKPDAPGGEFDDQLAWLSLQTLYARMRAARTLPN